MLRKLVSTRTADLKRQEGESIGGHRAVLGFEYETSPKDACVFLCPQLVMLFERWWKLEVKPNKRKVNGVLFKVISSSPVPVLFCSPHRFML